MNIFGIASVLMYSVAFFFMIYSGKNLMHTSYADLCSILSLVLLLAGAILTVMQEKVWEGPKAEKKWKEDLEEIHRQLEARKKDQKDET